jgi:hypothetical protein
MIAYEFYDDGIAEPITLQQSYSSQSMSVKQEQPQKVSSLIISKEIGYIHNFLHKDP